MYQLIMFFKNIRILALAITVVGFIHQPIFCLIALNFETLFIMIATGLWRGLKEPYQNTLETWNEFMILIVNYHLFLFTNFVADPELRS